MSGFLIQTKNWFGVQPQRRDVYSYTSSVFTPITFLFSLSLSTMWLPMLGTLLGEILSTINSPCAYWLTLQHSTALAGHSCSALVDRQGPWAALALSRSGSGEGGVGLGLPFLTGATSDIVLRALSWADATNSVQWATTNSVRINPSCQALLETRADLGYSHEWSTALWFKIWSTLNVKEIGHWTEDNFLPLVPAMWGVLHTAEDNFIELCA